MRIYGFQLRKDTICFSKSFPFYMRRKIKANHFCIAAHIPYKAIARELILL